MRVNCFSIVNQIGLKSTHRDPVLCLARLRAFLFISLRLPNTEGDRIINYRPRTIRARARAFRSSTRWTGFILTASRFLPPVIHSFSLTTVSSVTPLRKPPSVPSIGTSPKVLMGQKKTLLLIFTLNNRLFYKPRFL